MHLSIIALIFSVSLGAFAQSAPSVMMELLKEPCAEDIQKFCSDREAKDVLRCLGENRKDLSVNCKEGFQRAIQASQQAQSRGGGALGAFGGMNFIGPPVALFVLDSRVVRGEDPTPKMADHRVNLNVPVYRGEKSVVSASAAYGNLNFAEELTLDSGIVVPTTLQRAEIGAQYLRMLEDKRSLMIRGSIGYAGDTIFENGRDMTFSMTAMYTFPGSEQSTWGLTGFFANNSPIGNFIPIPGFVYIYRTENFTGVFGLPIASINWTPAFPWSLSMSIFGPTVNMEAAYGSINSFQLFGGAQWVRQLYMLENRVKDEDRLVIEEKKVLVGIRTPLLQKVNAEVQIGKSLDRAVFYGEGSFDKDGGELDLKDGGYINIVIRALL